MNEEEAIRKKYDKIAKMQTDFEQASIKTQSLLSDLIAYNFKDIIKSPKAYNSVINTFYKEEYSKLVGGLANSLVDVIELNSIYFEDMGFSGSVKAIEKRLFESIGMNGMTAIMPDGYINDILTETSVKRSLRQVISKSTLYNNRTAINEISTFIKGNQERLGVYETLFSAVDKTGGSIYDSFQRVDRFSNVVYSDELGIQAWLYIGGVIGGSRDFCIERNSKVFLKEEIDAWAKLSFQGQTSPYTPFIDLGGYRCRHTLGALGNSTAIRLDPTLYLDDEGVLRRK